MEDFAIKIENIHKTFKLPHERHTSLKSVFVNVFSHKKGYEIQKALDNVSIEIKRGEFFGIVGRNGSGKSTLLKLIAGIYTPTKGDILIQGILTPFIELGVGFSPELTGRENVYLNGALLGFTRKEMQKMYKDIVDFAELEKFMDQKLKNYSSGMQVRLAFSIAVRAQSDILLIDEVLAVGDLNFQEKCFDYFDQIKKEGRTVVYISHDMGSVRRFCDRAALINNGKLKIIGDPDQIAEIYEEQNIGDDKRLDEAPTINKGVAIENLKIQDFKPNGYDFKDNLVLRFKLKTEIDTEAIVGINLLKNGQLIAGITSQEQIGYQPLKAETITEYQYSFDCAQLTPGHYTVDGIVYSKTNGEPIFFKSSMAAFKIKEGVSGWGSLNLAGSWKITS